MIRIEAPYNIAFNDEAKRRFIKCAVATVEELCVGDTYYTNEHGVSSKAFLIREILPYSEVYYRWRGHECKSTYDFADSLWIRISDDLTKLPSYRSLADLNVPTNSYNPWLLFTTEAVCKQYAEEVQVRVSAGKSYQWHTNHPWYTNG